MDWKAGLPVITTPRLTLKIGDKSDINAELAFYRENEDHLAPWFPDGGLARLNRTIMEQYVPEYRKKALHDQGYRFQVTLHSDPKRYAGIVTLGRIQRGPEQCCTLGYGIAKELEGKGYMVEAVRAAIQFAFEEIDLHRIEAGYAPNNVRSGCLLKACGFEVEGLQRGLLLINGKWVDHYSAALLNPDWRGQGRI